MIRLRGVGGWTWRFLEEVGVLYARMTRIKTDPAKVEAWIAHFKEERGTAYQKAPGYRGTFVLVNRHTGDGTAHSCWETLEAMNAAEQVAQEDKRQVIKATGIEVRDVDRFEVVVLDRQGELSLPAFTNHFELYVAPDRLDKAVEFGRSQLPNISAQPGYRALIASVNRMTGRSLSDSIWASPEARAANNAAATAGRQKVSEVGGPRACASASGRPSSRSSSRPASAEEPRCGRRRRWRG